MIRNLRDLPGGLGLPAIVSALVAVLVGYSGPMLIVIQAAENAGLDRVHLSSWIWAITVGSGASAILLSLWHRQPILVAWPVAGIALLVSSLPQYAYAEAIGAYTVAALALIALGVSGLFSRVINRVPTAIIAGMLAGVLLRLGWGFFAPWAMRRCWSASWCWFFCSCGGSGCAHQASARWRWVCWWRQRRAS